MTRAVVLAAGEGIRLRPLTQRWPKPALPIDGRPVVVTLLHELASGPFDELTVVTGHLAERVEALLEPLPYSIRFVRQPEPIEWDETKTTVPPVVVEEEAGPGLTAH